MSEEELTAILVLCVIGVVIVALTCSVTMSYVYIETNNNICKQLYTNTQNYLNCKSNNIDKTIKSIREIK